MGKVAKYEKIKNGIPKDAGHYVVEDAHERIVPWMDEFLQKQPLS